MEEATERLVKLFLESKGFLVRTNEKAKIEKNRVLEIDIIAVRLKQKKDDDLPNKIIGEVKSWALKKDFHEEKHATKFKPILLYKKEIENYVNEKYGGGFKQVIFARKSPKKHKEEVDKLLKNMNIKFVTLEKVVKEIVEYAKKHGYTNDPELQILRLLKITNIENGTKQKRHNS